MDTKIYNQNGKEEGNIKLPEAVFGLPWNGDLVHQVLVSMQNNARIPIAHTKDRSEVSGGGRKPWKQKGTGRARHGSIRSPIWIGGGIAHGPRNERSYKKKINKKMKAKAFYTVLSQKFERGEILLIDNLKFEQPKTSDALKMIKTLSTIAGFEGIAGKKNNSALIAILNKDENTYRSFDNFGNLEVDEIKNLNVLDLLNYKYLIITNPKESVAMIEKRLESKANTAPSAPVEAKKESKSKPKEKELV